MLSANIHWRAAHGFEALPSPERPSHPAAAQRPNLVAAVTWKIGEALSHSPLTVGSTATVNTLLETIIRLHRELPKHCDGFAFSAERPGDRHGFVV